MYDNCWAGSDRAVWGQISVLSVTLRNAIYSGARDHEVEIFFLILRRSTSMKQNAQRRADTEIVNSTVQGPWNKSYRWNSQPSNCGSLDITSMAAEGQLAAWPQDEWEPLTHMMEDRNREKERRHLSQAMTWLQGWSHLEERRDPSRL